MPTTSGGHVPTFPAFFVYSIESTRFHAAMLATLIAYVLIPIFVPVFGVYEKAWLTGLALLVICTTTMIAFKKVVETWLFVSTTLLLAVNAVVSTFFGYGHYHSLLTTFTFLVMIVFLPYFAMCCKQSEMMHRLIAMTIVFPLLLGAHSSDLTTESTIALIAPAFTFFLFKAAAHEASSSSKLFKRIRGKEQILLNILGGTVLGGAVMAAVALAEDQQQSSISIGGFALAVAGGCVLNVFLVTFRWKNPKSTANGSDTETMITRIHYLFLIIAVILFICADLVGIYQCLDSCRMAVIAPVILLIGLYFSFLYLHNAFRGTMPNWTYFLLILGSLIATYASMQYDEYNRPAPYATATYPPLPVVERERPSRAITSTAPRSRDEERKRDSENQRDAITFAALECCLILSFLMVAALRKADEQAKRATEAAVQGEEGEEMLQPAAAATTAEVPAETVATPSKAHCSAFSRENETDLPSHTSLNLPD